MFNNNDLKTEFKTSSTVESKAQVLVEWNMNVSSNIDVIGNYRYRPTIANPTEANFGVLKTTFVKEIESSNPAYYYGATLSDTVIDGGSEYDAQTDQPVPLAFTSVKENEKFLYSLEDCFNRFRPRSGINKLRYFDNRYTHYFNEHLIERPRYYIADRQDKFKYWTSYRQDSGVERGISFVKSNKNYIDDASPFVVYKNQIPTNRIVLKTQTNVGTYDMVGFSNLYETFDDPFFGDEHKTTPVRWKVQYLTSDNTWTDATAFTTDVFGADGYAEIVYGLKKPTALSESLSNAYYYAGKSTVKELPSSPPIGYAFLINATSGNAGTIYLWNGSTYQQSTATYGWSIKSESNLDMTGVATELLLSKSEKYNSTNYREFCYIKGIRVVVETMNVRDCTFDLIELSPRFLLDASKITESFTFTKSMSDLGLDGLPVGQLIPGAGQITIFDTDDAFNINNEDSIIANHLFSKFQVKFYEKVVLNNNQEITVPLKTLYSDLMPQQDAEDRSVVLDLKDLMFYFDSLTAPQLMLENVSLNTAISILLDAIGFSNYKFKKLAKDIDPVIPHFFVGPDTTVSQILQELAISTQSAMYFDEDNNLIIVHKNYMLPTSSSDRATDITLLGTQEREKDHAYKNKLIDTNNVNLSNIISVNTHTNTVYNGGTIRYDRRHIQRSYASIKQASVTDKEKNWTYKPALLWEVSGTEATKSKNNEAATQSSYVLTAIPLATDLSSNLPTVVNGVMTNNIMDLGQGIQNVARYNGYFFANGEIIKYDAVEFSVDRIGNVWISSNNEYQNYFSKISFNGKIYPTGRVRIFSEPQYSVSNGVATIKNGIASRHGRGQFNTTVVSHKAGLAAHWSNNANVRGMQMDSYRLFGKQKSYQAENVYSKIVGDGFSKTILMVPDASLINVGDTVTLVAGTGKFAEKTRVSSISYSTTQDTPDEVKISKNVLERLYKTDPNTDEAFNNIVLFDDVVYTTKGKSGYSSLNIAKSTLSKRSGIIKNFLSTEYLDEKEPTKLVPGTIQSSAFVFKGPEFSNNDGINFISYVTKKINDDRPQTPNNFTHFGTRLRIIGDILATDKESGDSKQIPLGSSRYFETLDSVNTKVEFRGGSAGIAILTNPETNSGYFLELIALTESNVSKYSNNSNINNLILYKTTRQKQDDTFEPTVLDSQPSVPVKLWGGITSVLVDNGKFTGQYRQTNEQNPTVYDIAVEYEEVDDKTRKFYVYLNSNLVGVAVDTDKLPAYGGTSLFVRGSTKAMFENVYALAKNYSIDSTTELNTPVNAVFGDTDITFNEAFRKYSISGLIQSVYLSNIGANTGPKYNIYYDEFGTIMREAAYFNVKYDKAFPALYAKMSPTFNDIKGYTVSGFIASAYSAEFLIFNNTDTVLSLDETSGNYLRIQGVTFTQQSEHDFTMDDYFSQLSSLSDINFGSSDPLENAINAKQTYQDIKNSRISYGRNDFSLQATYLQTQDLAEEMMEWLVSKITKPRKSLGLEIFSMPHIQLGDVVKVDYSFDDIDQVNQSRYVVYSVQYTRDMSGPNMTIYLSEVT
jgi:hypothetical protein